MIRTCQPSFASIRSSLSGLCATLTMRRTLPSFRRRLTVDPDSPSSSSSGVRCVSSMKKTIAQKRVTYDFHRLMDGATLLKCSEFGDALIENL